MFRLFLKLLERRAKSGTGILAGQGFGVLYSKNRVPVLPLFFCVLAGVPVWVFLLCFPSADAGSPVFLYFPSRPGSIILPCLGVPNEPWRANCELRVFHLSLASPTGHWGPRSGNSALLTRCVRVMDQC